MSTWPSIPPSPNIHHKKLLTQCNSETKTKGVVGEGGMEGERGERKIQRELQSVPLLGPWLLISPSLVTKPDAV